MVWLETNGVAEDVTTYQERVLDFEGGAQSLVRHSLSGAGTHLTAFRLVFDPDAILNGGLVATKTSCVRSNDPGLHGEYRNGALTVQLVDANAIVIDPSTDLAAENGGLLWEATVFWHKPDATCL